MVDGRKTLLGHRKGQLDVFGKSGQLIRVILVGYRYFGGLGRRVAGKLESTGINGLKSLSCALPISEDPEDWLIS